VVMLGGFRELGLDFVADNPGRTLFHCHQQEGSPRSMGSLPSAPRNPP
jgi:FtsP/CotA-like multicopper oxidase with cupredoxin domain